MIRRYLIDPSAFSPGQRRHVITHPTGYVAFVPPPLPPALELTAAVVSVLSDADRQLGLLAGAGECLPNPHLLIRPFLRREAVLSSRIEGIQASVEDLVLFEAAPQQAPSAPDVQEVANYVRALEVAVGEDRELPLSLRLIRDLHRELMTGVRGAHLTPGEFRTSQNWIGPAGCTLNDAAYVPPPVDEMNQTLDSFEKYLHEPDPFPPLVRLALIHYQFEAIHPFLDGNGRIGRLLISLLLHDWRLLPQPLLYLSAFFARERSRYYELLLAVSQRGAWSDWVSFFLEGVAEQCADVIERSRRLFDVRERYRIELQRRRASALPLRLVDHLFEFPAITVPQAQRVLEVSSRAAGLNVKKLEQLGIIREVTGRARNRVFVAHEILDLLREP